MNSYPSLRDVLPFEVNQFDLKDQRSPTWNFRRTSVSPVAELRSDRKNGQLAFVHGGHSDVPALYDLSFTQVKLERPVILRILVKCII